MAVFRAGKKEKQLAPTRHLLGSRWLESFAVNDDKLSVSGVAGQTDVRRRDSLPTDRAYGVPPEFDNAHR